MILLISLFPRNVSRALFVLFISLSLYFLLVDFLMLMQVKHRGWVFIQGFYYENKGKGRGEHTGEGGEICKNKVKEE